MSNLSNLVSNKRKHGVFKRSKFKILQCYVHAQAKGVEADVREKVCIRQRYYPLTKFDDGKHYCFFHLPKQDKNISKFNKLFRSKLSEIESIIKKNEKLVKRKKKQKAISYDFRFVWFPSEVSFYGYEFKAPVYFCYATFSKDADFQIARFHQQAQFQNVTFQKGAIFADSHFYDGGFFPNAAFTTSAWFSKSIFYSDASFNGGKFPENCYVTFRDAVFFEGLDFGYLKSEANIEFSNLERNEMFLDIKTANQEICKLPYEWRSTKWKTRDERDKLYQKEPTFSISKSNISNTEKIIFQNVRLEPNWFVDIDARKFTFNACRFEYIDGSEIKLRRELLSKNLAHYKNKKSILKITCRHLAENAENNNRFEEASKFRQMAFECESQERFELWSEWLCENINCSDAVLKFIEKLKTMPILWLDLAHFAYRCTSYYGESWKRAFFLLLILVFVGFPISFRFTTFQVSPKEIPLEVMVVTKCKITDVEREKGKDELVDGVVNACRKIEQRGLGYFNGEAILHSFMAVTFQEVEYRRPLSFWAEFWTFLERIIVPLQAALLALAIRRKFMR